MLEAIILTVILMEYADFWKGPGAFLHFDFRIMALE